MDYFPQTYPSRPCLSTWPCYAQSTCGKSRAALSLFSGTSKRDMEQVWRWEGQPLLILRYFATGFLPGIHCLAYTNRAAQNDHTPPCMVSQESKRGEEWTPSSFCLHSRFTPCLGIPHHHRGTLLNCGQLLLHQDPKIFSAELVSNQSVPSPHCCMGFLHARCRTLLLPLINFMRFLLAHSSILWERFWMASLPPNYSLLTNLSPTDLLRVAREDITHSWS